MQSSTFAITVPIDHFNFILFLTVLFLPHLTKHDRQQESVTLEVIQQFS